MTKPVICKLLSEPNLNPWVPIGPNGLGLRIQPLQQGGGAEWIDLEFHVSTNLSCIYMEFGFVFCPLPKEDITYLNSFMFFLKLNCQTSSISQYTVNTSYLQPTPKNRPYDLSSVCPSSCPQLGLAPATWQFSTTHKYNYQHQIELI